MQQTTKEQRVRGEAIALFWNPTARNQAKRWTPDPMEKQWNRACDAVGVSIPLYQGTKHSTATALTAGGLPPLVLKALGGWKSWSSIERYANPKATRAALRRVIPPKGEK